MSKEQIEEMTCVNCIHQFVCLMYSDHVEVPCSAFENKADYRKQSEWISVKERLPKNNLARVLVFLADYDFTKPIGMNKIDTDRCIDGKWARWGNHVTHWMPLPDPPKMKGGMTLEKAIELLRKEYERAKNMEYVKKPLAWALFQVWKKADAMKGGAE